MGPIETEIRDIAASGRAWGSANVYNDTLACWTSSRHAFCFLVGAAKSLGFDSEIPVTDAERAGAWPDVLSEAIEAAEALGL